VLNWLTADELRARESFRALAAETQYVERGRVISRHVIADENSKPILFDGIVDKQLGDKRWSIFIEKLSRRVDLVTGERQRANVAIGRTVRGFAVEFNYLGPIADLNPSRVRR
jgi:hypothetical protein